MEITKIYFDMDDTLVDFTRGKVEVCGLPRIPEDRNIEDELMWPIIRDTDHYYYNLKPIPGAVEMVLKLYEKYGDKIDILTATPKPKRGVTQAGEDKINWIRDYISPNIKVNIVTREEKPNFCTGKGCILVDDLAGNIESWNKLGGFGIQFESPQTTLEIIEGYEKE